MTTYTQPDVIEKLGRSTIQHGKYNDRIYLLKASREDADALPGKLKKLAADRGYSKIFAKVPAGIAQPLLDDGFECEAQVPEFYHGKEAALMLGCFLDEARRNSHTVETNEKVMAACLEKRSDSAGLALPEGAELSICKPDEADAVAALYGKVFPTYPFPIDDPAYIRETMATHVVYFAVRIGGQLAALSSAEMDDEAGNVEMTDFATLPDHRGGGLASVLLETMETEMRSRGIATAYTIARAPSFGMNITFARTGYAFGGRLINNTNIGGQFEDMNVWHKSLA